ncbi:MAG: sugar phosphate isomerase/epimerase family protein [Chloroflexota bacterium]
MSSYTISAFADELGPDVDEQVAVLSRLGIQEIQLRGAWGKGVLDLSTEELRAIRRRAEDAGLGFHAIGSPLGKSYLSEPASASVDGVGRAAEAARIVGCDRVRVFSFYLAPDETPEGVRHEVLERLNRMAEAAESEGVILAHENERDIYGDTAARCLDLLDNVPGLRCCFDFANFVQVGQLPGRDCWPLLRDRVLYFDVKDADSATGQVMPAGEGDGDVREIIHDALERGFSDRFNLEPHLSSAGRAGGLTSPEQFESAASALRRILDSQPV